MKNSLFILFLFVFFLNGCTKIPEVNMTNHKGEGYFVGILQPSQEIFIPMEFILALNHNFTTLTETKYEDFSVGFFFRDKEKKQLKTLSDYEYYFVIVKGEMVDKLPGGNKWALNIIDVFFLRIDKIVYLRVVDKEFVKCLFNKEISAKQYENYYLKHPKEILKLCPCKPLKEIKKGKHRVFL